MGIWSLLLLRGTALKSGQNINSATGGIKIGGKPSTKGFKRSMAGDFSGKFLAPLIS